jgi:PAS domain S-box-containing protein
MGMWFEILLLAGLPAVAAGIGFAAGRLPPLRQDRKKQAAEQRLTSLASRFPGVIYRRILHPDGTVSYPEIQEGSDSVLALHRMVGDDRIDLADMGRDVIDREHFEHWREAVLTSARDGSPFQVETRMQTPEGSRWVRSVAATRREDDGSVVWDGVLLDITDLKETEAALHKREMEYRLLADHSRDIISRHSADGTCTYVSPAATILLGYRVEELIGASPFDFVHPDDVERLRAAHQRILDGALPAGCAYRIRHRDGSWLWIETHGSVVCNADTSETIQIVCVSRDVSDRQEAQEALHRSEERLRLAIAGTRCCVFDYDVVQGGVWRSPEIGPMLGIDPADIRPDLEWWQAQIHPDDRRHIRERLARCMSGPDTEYQAVFRICRSDGSFIWVEDRAKLVRDGRGRVVRVTGLMVDISDRVARERALEQAQAALVQREEFLRQITDAVPAAIGYVDHDLSVRFNNHRAAEWFGSEEADLVGLSLGRIFGMDRLDANRPQLEAAFSGEAVSFECPGCSAESGVRDLRVHYVPHRAPYGKVAGLFVLADDISDFKQVERQLRDAKAEADQANLGKSRFLAAASHDLRQPLNAMSLLLDVLRRRLSDPEGQDILAQIQGSLDAMIELFNALLNLSSFETGRVEVTRRPVALSDLLQRVEADFKGLARAKGLAFRTRACPMMLFTDPTLLEQILRNLIANAIRYTEKGGVLVGCRRRGGLIRIDVVDTGPGIPPEKADTIFEEFYQIANKARRREQGYGLGLAIVRRAADLLGHSLEMISMPGRGSRFSVEVPLAADLPADLVPAVADAAPEPRRGCSVFLLEDDPLVRMATRLALEEFGCAVTEAATLTEATERAASNPVCPDLIISDYRLPGGNDGIAAIIALREYMGRDVAACVITGDLDRKITEQAKQAGCRILHKPIRMEDLKTLVEAIRPL